MRVLVQVVLTVVLASIAVGFPASAVAQTPVSVSAPTPIAAYGERLVWSRPDGAGGFELVQRVGNGPVRLLPVRPRSVPFDVDLGPTSGGHVLAVYTRCATEPPLLTPEQLAFLPYYASYEKGRGCDVYKLDLNGGREARYTKVDASDATELWPTYWKGRLGFARVYDSGRGSSHLYVNDVASSRPSERLPGGPVFTGERPVPEQLELYGSRLAFIWPVPSKESITHELRVDTVGSKDSVVLDRGTTGLTALEVGWPSFESGRAYWAHPCYGDGGGCTPARTRLSTSTYTGDIVELGAPFTTRGLISHERAAGITWVLRFDSTQGRQGCCVLEPLRPSYKPLR